MRSYNFSSWSMFDPEMIICVNETVSAQKNSVRSYGCSLKGMRAVSHELSVSGQRINAIAAMSTEGMEDENIVEGNVTGEVFIKFVTTSLTTFYGTNSHSVIVVDNASVHHSSRQHSWSWCNYVFFPHICQNSTTLKMHFLK